MPKWYCTFGQGYSLRNNFVVVEAENYQQLMDQIKWHYGTSWSCAYTEGAWRESKQEQKYGLTEVPLGTPNVYEAGKGHAFQTKVPVDPVVGEGKKYSNEFQVEVLAAGDQLLIHRGPVGPLTRDQAYCLAAWIIVKAHSMPGQDPFNEVLREVERHASA